MLPIPIHLPCLPVCVLTGDARDLRVPMPRRRHLRGELGRPARCHGEMMMGRCSLIRRTNRPCRWMLLGAAASFEGVAPDFLGYMLAIGLCCMSLLITHSRDDLILAAVVSAGAILPTSLGSCRSGRWLHRQSAADYFPGDFVCGCG